MATSEAYVEYLEFMRNHGPDANSSVNTDLKEIKVCWESMHKARELKAISYFRAWSLRLSTVSYSLLAKLTSTTFDDVIDQALDLHIQKNAGYSPDPDDAWANFRECETFGISAADGCLVRLSDKYVRFTNVYRDPAKDKVGESAVDTLKDMAAYAIILLCLIDERIEKDV
jgi:hypothetical protein